MRKIYVKDLNGKYQHLFNKVVVKNRRCKVCGNGFQFSSNGTEYNNGRIDNNCCENCQFWVDNFMYDLKGDGVIINREHYRLNNTGIFNFGGQKFTIEYADGRRIVTELGHQGSIPDHFAESFPDNAKFVKEPAA